MGRTLRRQIVGEAEDSRYPIEGDEAYLRTSPTTKMSSVMSLAVIRVHAVEQIWQCPHDEIFEFILIAYRY
jgi:hypothetical protein